MRARAGRISIRSAYRSEKVNEKGVGKHRCGMNEGNYARHIWDKKAAGGRIGATACIVVHSFQDYYEKTGHWEALAWWMHDNFPDHAGMEFFSKFAAFNVSWSAPPEDPKKGQKPEPRIKSYVPPTSGKILTKPGMSNFSGSHAHEYQDWVRAAGIK